MGLIKGLMFGVAKASAATVHHVTETAPTSMATKKAEKHLQTVVNSEAFAEHMKLRDELISGSKHLYDVYNTYADEYNELLKKDEDFRQESSNNSKVAKSIELNPFHAKKSGGFVSEEVVCEESPYGDEIARVLKTLTSLCEGARKAFIDLTYDKNKEITQLRSEINIDDLTGNLVIMRREEYNMYVNEVKNGIIPWFVTISNKCKKPNLTKYPCKSTEWGNASLKFNDEYCALDFLDLFHDYLDGTITYPIAVVKNSNDSKSYNGKYLSWKVVFTDSNSVKTRDKAKYNPSESKAEIIMGDECAKHIIFRLSKLTDFDNTYFSKEVSVLKKWYADKEMEVNKDITEEKPNKDYDDDPLKSILSELKAGEKEMQEKIKSSTDVKVCKHCGHETPVSSGMSFCGMCGKPFVEDVTCPKCGHVTPASMPLKFCGMCGTRIRD